MRILTSLILLLTFGLANGQSFIEGKVIDFDSKEPVPFATVVYKGSAKGAITDFEGHFKIVKSAQDTLVFSSVGYRPYAVAAKDLQANPEILLRTDQVTLQAVEIKAPKKRENPAIPIIKAAIKNRDKNRADKLDAYQAEVYNKVEFDINNITEDFKQRRALKHFQFIFENIDTLDGMEYLPIFITESLSDYYFRSSPDLKKEIIKASKVSGLENESVTQFMGDMYQNVEVYDNNIRMFGRSFISPMSGSGLAFYKYYLLDSLDIENRKTYKLRFLPRRDGDPLFTGDLFIDAETYAVASMSGEMAGDVNINFIRKFKFEQDYTYKEDHWLVKREKLIVDFSLTNKSMGMFGKKTTSYENYILNKPKPTDFFDPSKPVEVLENSDKKGADFWATSRHETLTDEEVGVYEMVDSLKNVPRFNTYLDILQLVFTGYKVIGKVELGPYSKLYSYNPIEGHRFRFGMRTSNAFSTRVALGGFVAYGLRDEEFKYGVNALYFISKSPRTIVTADYSKDVVQLGQSNSSIDQDNVFSAAFRRNPATKLSLEKRYELGLSHEWIPGFSTEIAYESKSLEALGTLNFSTIKPESGFNRKLQTIHATTVNLSTRFAYRETFVSGEFDRISLGTKYPVLKASLQLGIKGQEFGDFEYQKFKASVQDETPLGIFGDFIWRVEGGKTWGKAPFPLQEVHNGNETFFLNDDAFNTMNFFEFVSSEFVSFYGEHHFQGFFLNRIPLLKKLQWRELVTAKAVYGRYQRDNEIEPSLPAFISTLERKPFLEASVGVENIFKVLRIEGLWRLSYLDNPDIVKFGIRAKLQIRF